MNTALACGIAATIVRTATTIPRTSDRYFIQLHPTSVGDAIRITNTDTYTCLFIDQDARIGSRIARWATRRWKGVLLAPQRQDRVDANGANRRRHGSHQRGREYDDER